MLQQYDDHAARTEAAFNAFARVYSLTTPPPKAPSVRRSLNWSMIGLTVVTVAAVLVSGDRTIDEFGGWPRGVVAFVMLEVTAIVFSFILTTLMPDGAHSKKLIWLALFFVLAIMVGANVHAIGRLTGLYISPAVLTAILMLVAISAPVLTAINGHLTAVEWKGNRRVHQLEMNAYEGRLARWREGLNAAWATNKSKYDVAIRVERERPVNEPQLPVHSLRSFTEPSEYTKNMSAREIISGWFTEHPERIDENVDALWKDIMNDTGRKVGRTSVHNVRSELRGGKQ